MKKKDFSLEKIDELTIYTGNFGKNRCTCQCPGCSQTAYGMENVSRQYQGTIAQIEELIPLLPSLKKAYFLGNPDCSVDAKFCNEAAKLFVEKGIHVMFSTSGIGGKNTMRTLLNGIDPKMIDYVSFSIDSLNHTTESILKGKKVCYNVLLKGIDYCNTIGVPIKIQPTIWQLNQENCVELIDFLYYKHNVNWFTFHAGSLEGLHPHSSNICKHVRPDTWRKTAQGILEYSKEKKIKTAVPKLFLSAEEYKIYQESYITHCSNPAPTNLQVWLERNTVATLYPLLANVFPSYYIVPLKEKLTTFQPIDSTHICPIQRECLGEELAKEFEGNKWQHGTQELYYACRFYKEKV